MANYNTQYYTSFQDTSLVNWRVDLALKDGPETPSPVPLLYAGDPVVLDIKNSSESKFEYILKTQCTLQYMYTGEPGQPHPEEFITVENDTWMVSIYRNGEIFWKGFINPDNNTYPWVPAPFPFTIFATDLAFTDGVNIDLDDTVSFLYDHITIGEFINRTLFHAVGYDDPVLNIMYTPKPDVIGMGEITDSLYVHTDAFYDFDKGPMFVSDALNRFLSSAGARLFHANGVYWMQYISDVGNLLAPILQITPANLSGTVLPTTAPISYMGNGPGDAVVYRGASQEIMISKSLRQKTFHFPLRAINQLLNFDWRDFTPPENFPEWQVSSTMNVSRVGAGTLEDSYRLRIFDRSPGAIIPFIAQNVTAVSGQRLQVQLRIVGNFAKDIGIGLQIGPTGGDQVVLNAGGEWVPRLSPGIDNTLFPITIPNTNIANVDIMSAPIPAGADTSEIRFLISYPRPVDTGVPPGEDLYVDVYPAFVRRFNDLYIQYDEVVKNETKFSYVADDEELFFLDKNDDNLSNSFFYNDGGTMKSLPLNNWNGQNIDELVVKQQAIQQSGRTTSVLGTFTANSFTFEQGVLLRDKSLLPTIPIRDTYNIKSGIHGMMVSEQQREPQNAITYTIIPITKEQQ